MACLLQVTTQAAFGGALADGPGRGMAALEENEPPIVHRDLKPTNVFIDAGEQLSYI